MLRLKAKLSPCTGKTLDGGCSASVLIRLDGSAGNYTCSWGSLHPDVVDRRWSFAGKALDMGREHCHEKDRIHLGLGYCTSCQSCNSQHCVVLVVSVRRD